MAIFTITNGESSELAVVKVTPVIEDCFTIYEYIVTTNNGDNITIDLSGNHFQAKYFNDSGAEVSFSDTTTLTYNTYLKIRFLLLNSGTSGIFSNATINIKNNTLDKFYENFVERNNDTANCYNTTGVESVVAGTNITVDNTDPKNPIVSSTGGVGAGDNLGDHTATETLKMNGFSIANVNGIEVLDSIIIRSNISSGSGTIRMQPTDGTSAVTGLNQIKFRNNNIFEIGGNSGVDKRLRLDFNTMTGIGTLLFQNNDILWNNQSLLGGGGSGDNLGDHVATQNIDMSGNKVINSGVPVNNNDLITKIYGDTNYAIQTSGTFTPVLTSTGATYTYSTQRGIYNKVGKNVTFTIMMYGINTSGTPSGQLRIAGMPFSTSLDPITLFSDQYIFAGVINNTNVPIYSVTFSLAGNTIGVLANQSLTDSTFLSYSNVSFTDGSLLVSGTYITD